ncbi:recombination protein RecR [Mycoplasmopsis mucosicanis]|uniref:Recombination protein RecR n=1 Tax=Mycoplasmopsis mucosicanis TaxID=458208 RepID=A0A507SQD9_9BACT|nr:toprim domain-containing protein [Mycoplasmopsis mucosicanis]TQC51592.1 recombination protein RecR [Mycoplasmopsis mucosicanis]
MKIKTIDEANEFLRKIPGISKKQADKITSFILNQPKDFTDELTQKLNNIHTEISFCSKCNFIKEHNKCLNCDDVFKTKNLMIVESSTSLNKIDEMGVFLGYYFVLPYLMSAKKTNSAVDYNYPQLLSFINQHEFEEVIIVLSPTLEGELTTNHLITLLEAQKLNVSRAAIGLPLGSNIEYLDSFTIKQAINNRKSKE